MRDEIVLRFIPGITYSVVIFHIGHMSTLICNFLYAKKNHGTCYIAPEISTIGLPGDEFIRPYLLMSGHRTDTSLGLFRNLGIPEALIKPIPMYWGGLKLRQEMSEKLHEETGISISQILDEFPKAHISSLIIAVFDFLLGSNVIIRGGDWKGVIDPDMRSQIYVETHRAILNYLRGIVGQGPITEHFAPLVLSDGEKISKSAMADMEEDSVVVFREGGCSTENAPGISPLAYLVWMAYMSGEDLRSIDDFVNYYQIFDIEFVPEEINFLPEDLLAANEVVEKALGYQSIDGDDLEKHLDIFSTALGINTKRPDEVRDNVCI